MAGERFTVARGSGLAVESRLTARCARSIRHRRAKLGVPYPPPSRPGLLSTASAWSSAATRRATSWRSTPAAASSSGGFRWARRCTARRRSPTCSTAGSRCWCRPARRGPPGPGRRAPGGRRPGERGRAPGPPSAGPARGPGCGRPAGLAGAYSAPPVHHPPMHVGPAVLVLQVVGVLPDVEAEDRASCLPSADCPDSACW